MNPHATRDDLMRLLEDLGIEHETHEHEPVFTVEEGNGVWDDIPARHCKNLFLKDAKKQLWLVTCPSDRDIDLKTLPGKIGSKRLSFGKPDLLLEVLGVTPGSVTPFSLMNDREARVTVVLDAEMMTEPRCGYHPLDNAATTVIAPKDLRRFIAHTGHEVVEADLR
ncbi:aminoacyl-tRNA editing enzymes YbaK, ProX [Caenispirillum salinarum AK4]|uniref:Aminoacyl-tRNA editing enzymes YbaK, ProX n=1 Tax=Caenispirillum salinarum AK4 TaxID=1238182 RepID=K9HN51_9PROT|nr:prolyl-tRNA synthetase associated domain-containing protein [Caenispirillum salinarum]EKV29976.1 aminoacyl-tRNA editing enzymes YbaK, ProX [Caenispirillum salinarum AK4]